MKRSLKFRYQMELVFSDKVSQHQFTLRMIPSSDKRQEITECNFNISPKCEVCEDTDTFGNKYLYGEIEEYHNSFNVEVDGSAIIDDECNNASSELRIIYRYQSNYTRHGKHLKSYYDKHKRENSETDLEYTTRLMHCIYNDMEYMQGVTGIETTAEQALEIGKGVCQDYTHIMISLLRTSGIPARYVVGMMMGEGFSHAWVEACIDGIWIGFDPTNDKMVDDTYIKISNGRDYQDCIVNRGVFYGCVTQTQKIKVIVSEV